MGALSSRRWSRLYVGVMLALVGLAVLQTVPRRHPVASLVLVDYRRVERGATSGKKDAVLVQKTDATSPLVFENFHLEWDPSRTRYGGKQFFVGDITNRSAAPCPVVLKVRYKNRNQEYAEFGSFDKEGLKPGEHFRVHCPIVGQVAAVELLAFDGTPEPLLSEVVPTRVLSFLLLVLLGGPLHIGLGGWMRPDGWERRIWNDTLRQRRLG